MIKTSKRLAVHICNAIISLLCILSIAMYFIQPLWKTDISYTLSGETMSDLLGDVMNGEGGEGGSTQNLDLEFDDIVIHMSITLQTQDVLASLGDNPTKGVQNMIDENVNSIIDQLTADLDYKAEYHKLLQEKEILMAKMEF